MLEEQVGRRGQAHRRAGVAVADLLHGVHGQDADRVDRPVVEVANSWSVPVAAPPDGHLGAKKRSRSTTERSLPISLPHDRPSPLGFGLDHARHWSSGPHGWGERRRRRRRPGDGGSRVNPLVRALAARDRRAGRQWAGSVPGRGRLVLSRCRNPVTAPPSLRMPSCPPAPVALGPVGAYVALTKPRIIELLLVTTLPAMVLAAARLPVLAAGRRDPGRRHAAAGAPTSSTASSTATSTP